jgi:hypothetical protein
MAKYIAAEKSEVWFVPAIANTSAPTATELNAGTRLTGHISGGFAADFAGNLVDAGDLTSAFNSTVAGTYGGGTNTISGLFRNNTADTAWNALPRGTAGYFVTQAGVSTGTAWASGDIVDGIFAAEVLSRHYPDLTRDALVTFDVDYAITDAPVYGATALT